MYVFVVFIVVLGVSFSVSYIKRHHYGYRSAEHGIVD